jgi:FixJ family two-component response regulator
LTDFILLIARRFLSFKRCAREFAMPEVTLISIVDDDQLARDGIRELIESFGYNAVTFTSAEHFLQSGVIAHTTCMIIDVQMPGLNGLELQETRRAKGYRTPVILITAYPNESYRKRALDGGAVGFLSKPFDEATLIRCLTQASQLATELVPKTPSDAGRDDLEHLNRK